MAHGVDDAIVSYWVIFV